LTSFPDGIKFHHEDRKMSWFQKIFNIKLNKSFQEENRNRAALECLLALAYGRVEIVKALIDLNRIRVKDLAAKDGISAVTFYNTINGRRTNAKAMELIASSLSLSVDDLFPEKNVGAGEKEPRTCTPEAPDRQP
jgi:hypothetical protein